MDVTLQEVITFLQKETSTHCNIGPETRIVEDLKCYGDDYDELILNFSKTFDVNIAGHLWFFHTEEESSFNIGKYLFSPPSWGVKRIPVTAAMLLDFALKGKWDIAYPTYTVPKYRFDIIISQVIIFLILLFSILFTYK